MRDFVLTEELLKIQGNVSDYYIPNEIDIAGKSEHDLARFLNGKTNRNKLIGIIN